MLVAGRHTKREAHEAHARLGYVMTSRIAFDLLCLWNDIAADRIDEYERWHTMEHVPERVWIPGFVSGTRYVRVPSDSPPDKSSPRYFTLYELQGVACLESAAYRDVVDHPTPWSASMRPSFSNFVRKTGRVVAVAGHILGTAIELTRLVYARGHAPGSGDWQRTADRLFHVASQAGVTRVRVQQVEPAGPQAIANADAAPAGNEFVILMECFDEARLNSIRRHVDDALSTAGPSAPIWAAHNAYRFASRVHHDDVAAPERPEPRVDLMKN
jgi:hypothetical protein